jgi:5-methylcytosine-specific restriction protein A
VHGALRPPGGVRRPLPRLRPGAAPAPQAKAKVNDLLRPCLGCGRQVRGKPRCTDCARAREQPKNAKRPDLHNDAAERRRRARVVADHRAIVGDWCPGWERRPAHPAADLTADHLREVAHGGDPYGPLVVRCRSCHAARSAHLAAKAFRVLTGQQVHDPAPAERPITHRDGDDPGPVAA